MHIFFFITKTQTTHRLTMNHDDKLREAFSRLHVTSVFSGDSSFPLQTVSFSPTPEPTPVFSPQLPADVAQYCGEEPRVYAERSPREVAFSADGTRLFVNSYPGIRILNLATGMREQTPPGMSEVGPHGHGAVAMSANGTHLLTTTFDNIVTLWDTKTLEPKCMGEYSRSLHNVAISADGSVIVPGSKEREITVLYTKGLFLDNRVMITCAQIPTETRHAPIVLSRDGTMLAHCHADKSVHVWDIRHLERTRVFNGHDNTVYDAVFSSDASLLLTASVDGTVRAWDMSTGGCRILSGHDRGAFSVAISPDDEIVLTGAGDGTLRAWFLRSNVCRVLKSPHHDSIIMSIAFSSDGRMFASSKRGNVCVWQTATSPLTRRPWEWE
jgi:WD40 repeat protein